jgi:hypothetical protein
VQRIATINVRPDDHASTDAENLPGLDTAVVYQQRLISVSEGARQHPQRSFMAPSDDVFRNVVAALLYPTLNTFDVELN